MIKFRTMKSNVFVDGQQLSDADRLTPFGQKLRRTSLDEIPEFWNVLKGELSLIGPRPETLAWTNKYRREIPFYFYRHIVRPGITGWAQVMQGHVHGIDGTRLKLAYDFYYLKHFSLWLDLLIVYKTIRTILVGHGSR